LAFSSTDIKWRLYNEETFTDGIVYDKERKTIAIYVKGDHMEDEFHFKVQSEIEAMKIYVSNKPEKYVARLPQQDLTIIGKKEYPNIMVIIKAEVCTRRLYHSANKNERYLFSEFHFEDEACEQIKKKERIAELDSKQVSHVLKYFFLILSNVVLSKLDTSDSSKS
jgi:hypothetical protein